MECLIWIFKWRHLVGKFRTNAGSVIWPKLEPMECLTWIFISTEFACFVAGEINQVIEAMPGSVVPLAMFLKSPLCDMHSLQRWMHDMSIPLFLNFLKRCFHLSWNLSSNVLHSNDSEQNKLCSYRSFFYLDALQASWLVLRALRALRPKDTCIVHWLIRC